LRGMRSLPFWEWPTILILQSGFAIACSIVANLIERDFFGLVTGIVIAPLSSLLMVGVGAGFFYYLILFVFKREVQYRQVYLNVLFSSIPIMLVSTVAFLLPPLIPIGGAATLGLLYLGLVDNFQLPRRPMRNIFFALLAIHILYWGFQQVQFGGHHKSIHQRATPESLDILEKELGK